MDENSEQSQANQPADDPTLNVLREELGKSLAEDEPTAPESADSPLVGLAPPAGDGPVDLRARAAIAAMLIAFSKSARSPLDAEEITQIQSWLRA